ncbi:hypothetical protein, partial [Neorhizobium galegae]|uniref:hypothetical protein n=1 Tax=Neorhizobium galegae TaxID=399 RepID=UPI002102F83E
MLDKGVVKLAVSDSPNADTVQAPPFDSNRLFAFDIASGAHPHAPTLSDRTDFITVQATSTPTDALPQVPVRPGPPCPKKRIFDSSYALRVA